MQPDTSIYVNFSIFVITCLLIHFSWLLKSVLCCLDSLVLDLHTNHRRYKDNCQPNLSSSMPWQVSIPSHFSYLRASVFPSNLTEATSQLIIWGMHSLVNTPQQLASNFKTFYRQSIPKIYSTAAFQLYLFNGNVWLFHFPKADTNPLIKHLKGSLLLVLLS